MVTWLKMEMWEKLVVVAHWQVDPQCVSGKLNVVQFPQVSGAYYSQQSHGKVFFLYQWYGGDGSSQVGFDSHTVTLPGGTIHVSYRHIPHLHSFEELFRCWTVLSLYQFRSVPIVIDSGGIKQGISPFRFKIMMLQVEGFKKKVRKMWNSHTVEDKSSFVFDKELKL